MSEQLSKIEKPSAEQYVAGRKLYFIPLIFSPREPPADLLDKINRYWNQVEEQVTNLEIKLGKVSKIYHELVPMGGDEGVKGIEELNKGGYKIAKRRLDEGAELQPIEEAELLAEFMDWNRCMAVGLHSQKAITIVYESYIQVHKKRNTHIAKQIDDTLKDGEAGILLMREGHQVQFPANIQVFYVAPPGLDDIKRWLRQRESETTADDQPTHT
jgi:hypothetical protein